MPLTATETAIIHATVPILETGGEALAKHFYGIMLRDHPVVVPFFNKAHQASGDQPRALANAVLMYAKNIEKLENLGSLVSTIVNKHVALNIDLSHYPIVGACLLQAIREVLGPETATDEVIAAWGAAYGQLSAILIGAEQGVYDKKAAAPGGWRGSRNFVVKDKVVESSEITSFYLVSADGRPILEHTSGQFIGLHITIDGEEMRRNYSISNSNNGKYYRISVKKEAGGRVSTHLHDSVEIGHVLEIYPPAGDFVIAPCTSSNPLVFIVGGVGITPCLAMLEDILSNSATAERPVTFIHCCKNRAAQAFYLRLKDLSHLHRNLTCHFLYSQEDSRSHLSSKQLDAWLPSERANAEAYFVGPKGFMTSVRNSLLSLGFGENQLNWEFFGPAAKLV